MPKQRQINITVVKCQHRAKASIKMVVDKLRIGKNTWGVKPPSTVWYKRVNVFFPLFLFSDQCILTICFAKLHIFPNQSFSTKVTYFLFGYHELFSGSHCSPPASWRVWVALCPPLHVTSPTLVTLSAAPKILLKNEATMATH